VIAAALELTLEGCEIRKIGKGKTTGKKREK